MGGVGEVGTALPPGNNLRPDLVLTLARGRLAVAHAENAKVDVVVMAVAIAVVVFKRVAEPDKEPLRVASVRGCLLGTGIVWRCVACVDGYVCTDG